MGMIEQFFDDVDALKRQLVDVARSKREQLGISQESLDRLCHLGSGPELPSCGQFEQSPSCLTAKAFSLVCSGLRLNLDEALGLDLSDAATVEMATRCMRADGVDVVAAVGGDVAAIESDDKARGYLLLKIMHELDEAVPAV